MGQQRLDLGGGQMAQAGDGFGRALAGDQLVISARGVPDPGDGQQLRAQRVLALQGPGVVRRSRWFDRVDRHLHGVERLTAAGQHGQVHQLGELRRPIARLVKRPLRVQLTRQGQPRHAHAVLGEGARLVHAQNRGRPQGFERGHAPRQDVVTGHAPGTQGQEDGQHDGEFFGQQGHGPGDGGQRGLNPIATGQAHAQQDRDPQHQHAGRHAPNHDTGGFLQRRAPGLDQAECAADAADFAVRASRQHLGEALPLHDQGAREHAAGAVIARWRHGPGRRPVGGLLVHRQGLAGEQGLIGLQVVGLDQHAVSGHAVPFQQHHEVARHQLLGIDALSLAIADDQGPGAGQVLEGVQRPLGAPLLHQGDAHHGHDRDHQGQALLPVSDQEVQHQAGHEQQEHGLARHLQRRTPQRPGLLGGQGIGAVGLAQGQGPLGGQAGHGGARVALIRCSGHGG